MLGISGCREESRRVVAVARSGRDPSGRWVLVGEITYEGKSEAEVTQGVKQGPRSWRKSRVLGMAAGTS